MRRAQHIGLMHKHELAEVIADGGMQIMIARRRIAALYLGFLAHLLVHLAAGRPLRTPVIPAADALGHALQIIGVDAIGKKAWRPVIDSNSHTFFNLHWRILSLLTPQITCHPDKDG